MWVWCLKRTALKCSKREYKKFFQENFFRPKIFEKPLFLAIFDQKFEKSSEPAELNRFSKNWWPKFFRPKIFEKPLFWPFLTKNSRNLVSLQSSIDVGKRAIAQNDRNTILMKWVKKFKKFRPKNNKTCFLAKKSPKKAQKSKKFFRAESI